MEFANPYKGLETQTLLPDSYDINLAFPLYEEALESERVRLTPFVPSLYAHEYASHATAQPNLQC